MTLFKYKDFRWKYELMGQIIKPISEKDFNEFIIIPQIQTTCAMQL